MWRDAVREKIRTRSLPQELDDVLTRAGKSATGATESLPQSASNDVDSAHHFPIFMRTASCLAQKTGCVRIINHHQRAIFFGQITDRFEIGDRSVHRKATIGRNQFYLGVASLAQLRFQIGHVVMLVTKALRFAETDAVNDGSMIQFIGDHRILICQQGFE